MRAFIAIELPKGIREHLDNLQEKLKTTQADVKWVAPENIHLTLKFLGEIDEVKKEKICSIMENATKGRPTYKIQISSMGAFPKLDFPRVIWVGVSQGDKETKEIAKELEEKIQKIGIPKEDRAFSSHITIGRTRSTKNREKLVQEIKSSEDLSAENLLFTVSKITLFKSTLTPKGPIYEALKEVSLTTT